MKKLSAIIVTVVLLTTLFVKDSFTDSNQPPAGRTGANIGSTETTCGTSSCHNNTPNSGTGNVSITFSDTDLVYVPGQTYDMTVATAESGKTKFGFEITVVDANGDSVGTWIIPNGTNNVSKPSNGAVNHRKYLGHKNASSTSTWSFQWKAPVTDRGHLTFFASGNCANGNGSESGDHIYTTSLSVDPSVGTGVVTPVAEAADFKIQSLGYGALNVSIHQPQNGQVLIQLFDMNGRLISNLLDENIPAGEINRTLKLGNHLSSGMYLVRFDGNTTQQTRKIFYSHE